MCPMRPENPLELKYCELCGDNFLRPVAARALEGEKYCKVCRQRHEAEAFPLHGKPLRRWPKPGPKALAGIDLKQDSDAA